jgi:Tfp pilus assembly pilus retraction ATPase PilT
MGRVACLEILFPDDAVRNLIRQGKVEQIYSVMQTSTQRGMQTMEHGLAELIRKRVVTAEAALAVSSRKDQLVGMLERSGVPVSPPGMVDTAVEGSALRIAGSG